MFRRVIVALVVFLALGRSADAATFAFRAVAATATAICPAPCFNIQALWEDSTPGGTLVIQPLRFDLKLSGTATTMLPIPPATSTNAGVGNTTVTDNTDPEAPSQVVIPFELSATIGKSPDVGQDV